jgi:hypothetical protein
MRDLRRRVTLPPRADGGCRLDWTDSRGNKNSCPIYRT